MTHDTARQAVVWLAAGVWALSPAVFAAETADPAPMTKTHLILKVDADDPLDVRTTFQERPPTITLAFPGQRVLGTLPERSPIGKGVIQAVTARYEPSSGTGPRRVLRSLQVVMTGPYSFQVRSESGRVVVDIDHPASISSASVEVGLRGGTVISGRGRAEISDRFRAMQEAMERAASTSWTLRMDSMPQAAAPAGRTAPASGGPGAAAGRAAPAGSSTAGHSAAPVRPAHWSSAWLVIVAIAGTIGFGAWRLFAGLVRAANGSAVTRGRGPRLPSGVMLIDQLVWRAFERQGYQLVLETELTQPLMGTLRIIAKDGPKSALLFLGHGPFFEKQTVERFVHIMRNANVEQGLLVASGSFTVPAQRLAKEHRVTLVGREQLTELLSAGAGSEYFTKQLAQSQAKLEEARETLRQYAGELDTLRRQRNEASWYLGEEREKAGGFEARIEELSQQLRHHEAEIRRWEQEAASLRKQWEESQWYLGESAGRARHLEAQVSALQDVAQRVEGAERARDEMKWYLGEEQTKTASLQAQIVALQQHLDDAAQREADLRGNLERLTKTLDTLRTYGNRRSRVRAEVPQAFIELYNGEEQPMFSGTPKDLSSSGVGLQTDRELPAFQSVRIRLRLPGQDEPIASRARLMWQRAEGEPATYRSGCKFVGVPAKARALIEQLVEETWKSDAARSA